MKALYSLIVFCLFYLCAHAEKKPLLPIKWRAAIHRPDGNKIIFNFEERQEDKKVILYVLNPKERLRVDSVTFSFCNSAPIGYFVMQK